jgi:hypothetical protein
MLVLAKLKLGHKKRQQPHGIGEPLLEELDNLLSDALKYTRSLVADLSRPVLRDHGLAASLRWLGEYMTKYELRVTIDGPEQEASPIQRNNRRCSSSPCENCSSTRQSMLARETRMCRSENRTGGSPSECVIKASGSMSIH